MKRILVLLTLLFTSALPVTGANFEELDKPPEGAHAGQMFLGAFFAMGAPIGPIFKEEESFPKDVNYEISPDIYKNLWVSHLAFNFGVAYEYMPIDYLGVKGKLKYNMTIQRTLFGPDYQNWTSTVYQDLSFLVGAAGHLTNRKQWDIVLTPVIGYSIAWFKPTPIAAKLLTGPPVNYDYTNGGTRRADSFILGSELNFTAYFSGGLYLSIGFDWTMNFMKFGKPFNLTIDTVDYYYDDKKEAFFHTVSFIVAAGYAFSN